MNVADWWGALEERLSQGDVVEGVPMGAVCVPLHKLKRRDIKGHGNVYVEDATAAPDSNGHVHVLARGPVCAVVVLSHSCELDKDESKGRVIVAQVASAEKLTPEVRERIFARRRIALAPLLAVPELGDCYADLRTTTSVDRRHIEAGRRVASMTDAARRLLHQAVAGFFVRDPAAV